MGSWEGDRSSSMDTVGEGSSSMVDSVVSERSGVDERGSVVDGVVGDRGGVDEGSGVVDEGLVGAGNTLILHVCVVLLVLIHKVVNNLSPAVRQVDHILTLDNGTLADLCTGVLVGVAISINAMHVVAKLVIMGDLLIRGRVDERSSMVDGMVSNWGGVDEGGSVMDSMVSHRGGVDKGGGVVDCMMGHRGGVA